MAGPAILAAKAALLLSDEQTRKRIGYAVAAIFVPLILVVAFLLSLLSGTTQHNNAVVDLVFNGGPVPTTMSAEYTAQVMPCRTAWQCWTAQWQRSTARWSPAHWTVL